MRKILVYILLFVSVCFLIPILLTNRPNRETSTTVENSVEKNQEETIKSSQNIKLLHTNTNAVEEVPLEEYLYGVVSAEMPASFEKEALKAQAIVARTYTIYKMQSNNGKHQDADICDNSACCQAWISKENRMSRWNEDERDSNWNKIVDAVNSTSGKIVTYEGKAINAFFHSNSGGKTETTLNVWGGSGYPYLQTVETAGEDTYSQYASELVISKEDFISKFREKHSDFVIDFSKEDCIKILEYTDGNRVKKVKIGNLEVSGVEVRTILGLRSANFNVEVQENNIKFSVIGYGHGVGMSQTGADSMAKQGSNCEEIIKHFYTGVEIENL